ncbi:amidohydrolase family protein [Allosphingosinicella flava]|uniref:Amidohydrolase family protein n=1 Tax=Allosphingosinicella flava TaxID=2771430 RepID=A0A7T2GI06_9SPHN|nr:amidohydrolase family protein [Sphingosinicella flava]QPQ54223.1 amidohydrolase family protein [Sphingosinicella flava]
MNFPAFRAIGLLIAQLFACSAALAAPAEAPAMWKNGRWFDGTQFVKRTMYSTQAGLLTTRKPPKVGRTVDLQGKYVVPAYGDAHTHIIGDEDQLDAKIAAFLREGIFYAKNPNAIPDFLTPKMRSMINRKDSIDVVFANGGLTGSGAHPAPLHDNLADRGLLQGLGRADMPGRAYHIIDDEDDLAASWPKILAGKPDFIKVFLNGGTRLRLGSEAGTKAGISPAMLKSIIRRAHDAGLRVMAHVETADDFAAAVEAGVDETAHLPHFGPRGARENAAAYTITPEVAAQAGARGVTVIGTASVLQRMHGAEWPEEARTSVAALHRKNIALLRQHGVRIAIGSDGMGGETGIPTAAGEAAYFYTYGLADNLDLLRMWSVVTPQTIFPDRKIGKLEEGYEANFLALDGDPLADPKNLHRIGLRVKGGAVLALDGGTAAD